MGLVELSLAEPSLNWVKLNKQEFINLISQPHIHRDCSLARLSSVQRAIFNLRYLW